MFLELIFQLSLFHLFRKGTQGNGAQVVGTGGKPAPMRANDEIYLLSIAMGFPEYSFVSFQKICHFELYGNRTRVPFKKHIPTEGHFLLQPIYRILRWMKWNFSPYSEIFFYQLVVVDTGYALYPHNRLFNLI